MPMYAFYICCFYQSLIGRISLNKIKLYTFFGCTITLKHCCYFCFCVLKLGLNFSYSSLSLKKRIQVIKKVTYFLLNYSILVKCFKIISRYFLPMCALQLFEVNFILITKKCLCLQNGFQLNVKMFQVHFGTNVFKCVCFYYIKTILGFCLTNKILYSLQFGTKVKN